MIRKRRNQFSMERLQEGWRENTIRFYREHTVIENLQSIAQNNHWNRSREGGYPEAQAPRPAKGRGFGWRDAAEEDGFLEVPAVTAYSNTESTKLDFRSGTGFFKKKEKPPDKDG